MQRLPGLSGLDGWQLNPDSPSWYDHMAEDFKFQPRLETNAPGLSVAFADS
jgi:hypothetical protein